MSYGWWFVVILLTSVVLLMGAAYLLGRGDRSPLDGLAPVAPGPRDVMLPRGPAYGPFPVDTGPLLLWSDQQAAGVALEREIRLRCEQAEAQIPPRWR